MTSTRTPFKWTDGLFVLLAVLGFLITNLTLAGLVLLLAVGVAWYGIIAHHNWRMSFKVLACITVLFGAWAIFLYLHHDAVDRALQQSKATLVAGTDPSPVNKCASQQSKNDTVLHLGSIFILVSKNIYPVLSIGGRNMLTVERKTYDFLIVRLSTLSIKSLQLFDDLGREAVIVKEDKYEVRPTARFDRKSLNNLSVFDYHGDEILNLEYTNDNMIQLRGVFRSRNTIIRITDHELINAVGGKVVGGTGCWQIADGMAF